MNPIKRVSEHVHALVFSPVFWCGKVVLVLHQEGIDATLGMLWKCRSGGVETELPEFALLALDLRGAEDPGARELLSEDDQAAWDAWFSEPDLDF